MTPEPASIAPILDDASPTMASEIDDAIGQLLAPPGQWLRRARSNPACRTRCGVQRRAGATRRSVCGSDSDHRQRGRFADITSAWRMTRVDMHRERTHAAASVPTSPDWHAIRRNRLPQHSSPAGPQGHGLALSQIDEWSGRTSNDEALTNVEVHPRRAKGTSGRPLARATSFPGHCACSNTLRRQFRADCCIRCSRCWCCRRCRSSSTYSTSSPLPTQACPAHSLKSSSLRTPHGRRSCGRRGRTVLPGHVLLRLDLACTKRRHGHLPGGSRCVLSAAAH